MIGAATFATGYGSIWREVAPTCDLFVRRTNLGGYERWAAPMGGDDRPVRKALVAEVAFSMFEIVRDPLRLGARTTVGEALGLAVEDAVHRLRVYASHGYDLSLPLAEPEVEEVVKIWKRLRMFFSGGGAVSRPMFAGCGYVSESEGDILINKTLYEVKTVDRHFRSSDWKQLIMYCVLNFAKPRYIIDAVGICNPRRGISLSVSVEELCREISGDSSVKMFSDLIDAISSGGISR